MPTPFARTLRSLDAERWRPSALAMGAAAALLIAWLAWFLLARVAVYEVSDSARLEAASTTHRIDAPALGRIVVSRLVLGKLVRQGEVLVELDADPQRLQLLEQQRLAAGLGPQLAALRAEVTAATRAAAEERDAARAAVAEAAARQREAAALATLAEEEAARAARLHAAGQMAELDLLRARAEAERRRAAADSARLAVTRLEREQRTAASDRAARIEGLRRELTAIEANAGTAAAGVERLESEAERRLIRAPVDGRIGEVADLRPGAVVDEGDTLGAIVPVAALRVVAQFAPGAALGRIRPGQAARLRLEGFPWAQHGSVAAVVARVGSEVRDGRVRVELALRTGPRSTIPLQHGLPGAVEVEVERLSPAALVLRAAGRRLADSTSHASAAAGAGGASTELPPRSPA